MCLLILYSAQKRGRGVTLCVLEGVSHELKGIASAENYTEYNTRSSSLNINDVCIHI